MTRPRGDLTTYRARGGHATDWANPTPIGLDNLKVLTTCFLSNYTKPIDILHSWKSLRERRSKIIKIRPAVLLRRINIDWCNCENPENQTFVKHYNTHIVLICTAQQKRKGNQVRLKYWRTSYNSQFRIYYLNMNSALFN